MISGLLTRIPNWMTCPTDSDRSYSRILLVSAAFLFSFIFVLVSPLSFYMGNSDEYVITLNVLLIYLFVIFLASSGFLSIIIFLISKFKHATNISLGILLGLSIFAWIQSQVLLGDFGLLDGSEIDWNAWQLQELVEVIGWAISIFVCTLICYKHIA